MKSAPFLVSLVWCLLTILIPIDQVTAAALVEAKHEGRFRTVIDAKGFRPVIEYEGKRKTLSQLLYKILLFGGEYANASYELKDDSLDLTDFRDVSSGDIYNSGLKFSCQIKVDAPLKDCFMALEFETARGETNIMVRELPNLKADRWKRISWNVRTHISFDRSNYRYFFFSEGKHIPNRESKTPLFSESSTERYSSNFIPAKIVEYHPLTFPEALSGKYAEGSVKLELTVLETGEVSDIKVLRSTHSSFEKPAIEAIKKCVWEPATMGGKPSSQTIRQTLVFKAPE